MSFVRPMAGVLLLLLAVCAAPAAAQAPQSRFAYVNGVRLHNPDCRQAEPVLLLHGYAQTSHMWRPLIAKLADQQDGDRARSPRRRRPSGHQRAATTRKRWPTTSALTGSWVATSGSNFAGHDIGLMVAYAYAAQYPSEVKAFVLDAFLPGVGDWKNVWLMRDLWHFHFYGEIPLSAGHRAAAHLPRTLLE